MIQVTVKGVTLSLQTVSSLFSPKAVDPGTLAMLSCVTFEPSDIVLDLGCGYGLVGVLAAKLVGPRKVFLVDNDPIAIKVATANLKINGIDDANVVLSDGFRQFSEAGFTKILSNPPYHADFSVPKHFIEKGFNRLVIGGRMFMVTKRELWYRKKFEHIFGGVMVREIGDYFVFEAIKKSNRYADKPRAEQRGRKIRAVSRQPR